MHDGVNFAKYSGFLGSIPNTYPYYTEFNNSLTDYYTTWRIPPQFETSNKSLDEELFSRYEYLNSDTF